MSKIKWAEFKKKFGIEIWNSLPLTLYKSLNKKEETDRAKKMA